MLIQSLQKWWIENPSLLNFVKTIQKLRLRSRIGLFLHAWDRFGYFNLPFLKPLDYHNQRLSNSWNYFISTWQSCCDRFSNPTQLKILLLCLLLCHIGMPILTLQNCWIRNSHNCLNTNEEAWIFNLGLCGMSKSQVMARKMQSVAWYLHSTVSTIYQFRTLREFLGRFHLVNIYKGWSHDLL